MILAIIFLVLFLAAAGVGIYFSISAVKSPVVDFDYKKLLLKILICNVASAIFFMVASFGFYMWLNVTWEALHTVQLVLGSLFFAFCLFSAIDAFILHYYRKNIPERLDKALFVGLIAGFVLAIIYLFVYTNGLSPYLTYPLPNGFSFREWRFVSPANGDPTIAFYALCILSGAGLVYFLCDHFFYKEYGKHGLLESTFIVAFPAGIIGARIWYVIGNWTVEFKGEPFWKVFAIWEGGLTILGGAIMGIVVGVLFFMWRNKGKSIWFAVDVIVPTILIAQAIGRWGNFFNCEVHGLRVSADYFKWLPGIIWRNAQYSSTNPSLIGTDQLYVPLFFIECFTNLLGYFVIAHVFGKALKKFLEPGDLCFGYVIWYGMTRVLMEPLRSADYQMGNNGYWSWVWSMLFVLIGTLLVVVNHIVRLIIKKKKNLYEVKPYDRVSGIVASAIYVVLGFALVALALVLMLSNKMETVVAYNAFNGGLMLLVVGVSLLLLLAVSLPVLINSFKKPQAVEETPVEAPNETL